MANPISIQEFGNQLAIIFDDGARQLAYPTSGGLWLIGTKENPTPAPPPPAGTTKFIWPFPLTLVTSEFGPRNGRLHAGIDFGRGEANRPGTTIKAAGAGKVQVAGVHGGYGNTVIIDHGGGRATLYGHMTNGSIAVSKGQTVTQGQRLGGAGNTGNSRGVHLHFETHEGGYRWYASAKNPRLMIPKWNG